MKVAHLITSKVFAGIEQHVFELATAMDEETDHIILCDKSLVGYMSGVPTHSITMGSRFSPLNIIRLVLFFGKIIQMFYIVMVLKPVPLVDGLA
jgi:hypothetical protein